MILLEPYIFLLFQGRLFVIHPILQSNNFPQLSTHLNVFLGTEFCGVNKVNKLNHRHQAGPRARNHEVNHLSIEGESVYIANSLGLSVFTCSYTLIRYAYVMWLFINQSHDPVQTPDPRGDFGLFQLGGLCIIAIKFGLSLRVISNQQRTWL